MTYKINGVILSLQPTTGRWIPREELGRDGNGHPIYPSVYSFEMTWDLIGSDDFYQLVGFFDSMNVTGSVVVDLPKYRSATGGFYSYTGCVLSEPEPQEYFVDGYINSVKLLVTNIRA